MSRWRGPSLFAFGLTIGLILAGWAMNLGVSAQDRFVFQVAEAASECHNCIPESPAAPSREWCERVGVVARLSGTEVGEAGSALRSAVFFDTVQRLARHAWAEKSVWDRLRLSVFERPPSDARTTSLIVKDRMFELEKSRLLSDALSMCVFMGAPPPPSPG